MNGGVSIILYFIIELYSLACPPLIAQIQLLPLLLTIAAMMKGLFLSLCTCSAPTATIRCGAGFSFLQWGRTRRERKEARKRVWSTPPVFISARPRLEMKIYMNMLTRLAMTVVRWFDSWAGVESIEEREPLCVDWLRCLPFVAMHLMCLGVIWVGWSPFAVSVAVALYVIRMFAITGIYHRYFSHRTFKTSRFGQFMFALLGACAVQRGPLWWAAHHRHHHRYSDTENDRHSPIQHGFLWSHMGWFMARSNFATNLRAVSDLAKFPELRFLDRFDILVAISLAVGIYFFGVLVASLDPDLGTSGLQLLIWGFFISTVAVYHGTYTINSLAHQIGRKRYETGDTSKNSFILSLITLGEGWHNNHHHYPGSVRQGFYWWEVDISYYILVVLSWMGVVWDLRPVPDHIRNARRIDVAEAA